MNIENEIAALFKTAAPKGVRIVPESLPIPFFGHFESAVVATLGFNPSDKEFLKQNGDWLEDTKRRFESYPSLGCESPDAMTEEMIEKAYLCCSEYFERPTVYRTWFGPFENVLKKATDGNISYANGKAAHFNLSPWATAPLWAGLRDEEHQILKRDGKIFLRWLIERSSAKVLLIDGRTTCETIVESIFGKSVAWGNNLTGDNWKFYNTRHLLGEKEIQVIGWNMYTQNAGTPDVLIDAVRSSLTTAK